MSDFSDETAATNVVVVDFTPRMPKGDPRPNEPSLRAADGPLSSFAPLGQCRHINILVNEDLAEVTCRDCDAKLNPIWVLTRMAREESKWEMRRSQAAKLNEALDKRLRCTCQHCGQMTRIK